jgi:hypothetical protein
MLPHPANTSPTLNPGADFDGILLLDAAAELIGFGKTNNRGEEQTFQTYIRFLKA